MTRFAPFVIALTAALVVTGGATAHAGLCTAAVCDAVLVAEEVCDETGHADGCICYDGSVAGRDVHACTPG